MDPSSISSPSTPAPNAVPFAVETNNHLPSPSSNHPPYAEMIYTAIEALKEKNGSSKRAISKYIEQVYSHQLPPPESHSNLLTHHLKRLKSDGLLQTIKNSYIIPRSAPPLAATEPPSTATASPSQPSKPRGRPRKSVTPTPTPPPPLPVVVVANNDNDNVPLQNAEPVWAALGLSDEPLDVQPAAATPSDGSKRRPGRPPGSKNVAKNSTAPSPSPSPSQNPTPIEGQVPPTPASRGRGRPPGSKSKSKKKPGRPAKVKTDTPTPASAAVASDGSKRRPGRPPKNQQQNPTPIPFATTATEVSTETPQVVIPEVAVPVNAVDGGTVLTPRSRGRPRKNPAVAAVPVSVVAGGARGRGRGRGRGGRGRGGRVGNAFGGITLRAPGKRAVGRPKKGTTPATASASQNAANEVDLRRKLEHFQGKIKESLTVIKPHFDHQSPVTALAAIQELEILGAMDLSEPLKDDEPHPSQPNAPAQDQPLQAVAQPQVFAQYPPFQQDYHYQQHQSQYQP